MQRRKGALWQSISLFPISRGPEFSISREKLASNQTKSDISLFFRHINDDLFDNTALYLNNHTYHSLRYGTLSPKELVDEAARRGLKSLVLTDLNNTSCMSEFIRLCKERDIKPAAGLEFRQNHHFRYVGIARNQKGFQQLNHLLSHHSITDQELPEEAPDLPDASFIYRQLPRPVEDLRSNEFIGIRPEEVVRLRKSPLSAHLDKLVIHNPVTFSDEAGFRTHKLLRCIDLHTTVGKLQQSNCGLATEQFQEEKHLKAIFENYPQIIRNTERLLDEAEIDLATGPDVNRKTFTGTKPGDFRLLKKLALEGWEQRYGSKNGLEAHERVMKELDIIRTMNFETYFLITWDITRYATEKKYHFVGRGSGANSIVAYCLGITDVEPLSLNLYFERFINPQRSTPPDFDIDFSWDERDDVTEYVFSRFGATHTALLGTYNTFKGKSIVRELGKVFGLAKKDIDLIVNEPLAERKHHPFGRYIFHYGKNLENLPNYLSIHAGGIVISEQPISAHTAVQMMPKGFPITHFDMYHGEEMGFHKYDLLSQRGIGHIKDAVKIIEENQGKKVDIHDTSVIVRDEVTRKQLKSGQAVGCFYIESPAMRGLLSKIKCEEYRHLVAVSSIIRPGVAKSGMMQEFIRIYRDPLSVKYLHPIFEEHLSETFGIMVYQEDVMKVVHHFAGQTLNESDMLRRVMTGKSKSQQLFQDLQKKFFEGSISCGHPMKLIREVWRQIESFSGYSFCKAHSASFAMESMQSLYLKAHYPLEFMVAVINNFGGFYDTEHYVHELRQLGATIEAPCINRSDFLTNIEGDVVFFGFAHVKFLRKNLAHRIVQERNRNGAYESLVDFRERTAIKDEQLSILIQLGSLRTISDDKYGLMWQSRITSPLLQQPQQTVMPLQNGTTTALMPRVAVQNHEQAFDEIEILGFPLCSPFELLPPAYHRYLKKTIQASQMRENEGKSVTMMGYYVIRKDVTTIKGRLMNFTTWRDASGAAFDSIHFPPILAKYPLNGKGIYLLIGTITMDHDFPSLEVTRMRKVQWVKDTRYA